MRGRRLVAVGVGVVMVVAALGAAAVSGPSAPDETGPPSTERLVQPDGTDSAVWPYTSRSKSVAGRTLALNVVVLGEPDRVRGFFVDEDGANWTGGEGDHTVVPSLWRDTTGAARYSYVTPAPDATGRWIEADYQLHVGAYFGERVHIRAYPSIGGNWTAMQAHTEYWDWFRLRHTVTGLAPAATFVADDLDDRRNVTGVRRHHHGFEGGRSPGWLTVIAVGAVGAVASVTARSRRVLSRDLFVLPAAMAAIVLGVRAGGLLVEGVAPWLPPKLLAAVGYPILAFGPLAAVWHLAPERRALRVAAATGVGLGGALAVDLAAVGVTVVPMRLVYHRVALAAAIALVTLGVVADDRRVTIFGTLLWLGALGGLLFGLV